MWWLIPNIIARYFGEMMQSAVAMKFPMPYHGLITVSVMLATMMQALDATIANVALPHMQGTLSATQDQMTWVLTSYIVASAIAMPLAGWLAGQCGRRIVLLVSIAGFTLASIFCGLAETLPQMVIFRLLQGICGAALVPLSQAVLFDINPPENYTRAMAIWGVGVTLGPILGPALGGWLTQNYNWRWVFFINLPIGIIAFFGLLYALPENKNSQRSRFDFFGFIALSIGVASLQLMLDRGELKNWFGSTEIIIEALVAILGFYWFTLQMLSSKKPFLSPALFLDRNFSIASIFIFLVGVILFANLALIPPLLQNQMGYPVFLAGLVIAPRGAGIMLGMILVGNINGRIDLRKVIAMGLGLIAVSLWWMMGFSLMMPVYPIVTTGIVQGLGIGLVYIPVSTVAFSTLPAVLRNEGTAFFNLVRNIGSAIGISVVQSFFTRNTQIMHASLSEHITPYMLQGMAGNQVVMTQQGLAALNAMMTNQAAMIAYIDDFKLMMILTLLVIPFLLLIKPTKPVKNSQIGGLE